MQIKSTLTNSSGQVLDIVYKEGLDPKDFKQYIDWGEIGDRLMERALEMFRKYNDKK